MSKILPLNLPWPQQRLSVHSSAAHSAPAGSCPFPTMPYICSKPSRSSCCSYGCSFPRTPTSEPMLFNRLWIDPTPYIKRDDGCDGYSLQLPSCRCVNKGGVLNFWKKASIKSIFKEGSSRCSFSYYPAGLTEVQTKGFRILQKVLRSNICIQTTWISSWNFKCPKCSYHYKQPSEAHDVSQILHSILQTSKGLRRSLPHCNSPMSPDLSGYLSQTSTVKVRSISQNHESPGEHYKDRYTSLYISNLFQTAPVSNNASERGKSAESQPGDFAFCHCQAQEMVWRLGPSLQRRYLSQLDSKQRRSTRSQSTKLLPLPGSIVTK